MFGKPFKQVCRLIKHSGIKEAKGTSKHQQRAEFRERFREEHGKNPTSSVISKEVGIYGQKTLENYRSIWTQFGEHLRERGVKDLEKASARQVQKFLNTKIEQGVTHKYYQVCCSAMRKLESALNRYAESEKTGNSYDFENRIQRTREAADQQLEKEIAARAYSDPQAIVDNIKNENHQIAAAIMLEGGARINEASMIDEKRMVGIEGENGRIRLDEADTKGGKQRDLIVSRETYQKIQDKINENGKFQIPKSDRQQLRESIRAAAAKTGQDYTGAHGLRHNFAQARVAEIQDGGASYGDALAQTSRELGHERPSITLHYLRAA